MRELVPELDRLFLTALRRRSPKHKAKMAALGIADRVPGRPPIWAAMPIAITAAGLWQPATPAPDERPRDAVIVPAGWADDAGVWFDGLDDLCAFYLDRPDEWFLLRGAAVLLGADNAFDAGFYRTPLDLHSCPLDWLRAGGSGCCVVDWRLVPALHLCDAPVLRCDAPALRDKLLTRHRQCQTPWQVTIAKPSQVAA